MPTTFLGLPYSPWSERARWALDLRAVPYQRRTYAPLIGEVRLRWMRGPGKPTVPVLITDDGVIGDGEQIARWANARGAGPDLFPAGKEAELARFHALADRALDAGRVRALHRVLDDADAVGDLVPRPLRWAGGASRAIARLGVRRTLAKYADRAPADPGGALRGALDELRGALPTARDERGARPLLGALSWADLTAAQALAFVSPPATGLRIGAGTRRAFVDPELAGPAADLLAWRDELYAAWRAPATGTR